jgi:hypothetical protein
LWILMRFLGNRIRHGWRTFKNSEPPDDSDKPH